MTLIPEARLESRRDYSQPEADCGLQGCKGGTSTKGLWGLFQGSLAGLPREHPTVGSRPGLPGGVEIRAGSPAARLGDRGRQVPGGSCPESSFISWIPRRPQTGVCRPCSPVSPSGAGGKPHACPAGASGGVQLSGAGAPQAGRPQSLTGQWEMQPRSRVMEGRPGLSGDKETAVGAAPGLWPFLV